MCGRYTIISGKKISKVVFNVTIPANLRLVERFNVAPSQMVPVIANDSRELQMFKWGLIPSWAKDEKIAYKLINARAETLAEKPSFRRALAKHRCVIPADGFYEWRKGPDGKTKTPMYIRMQNQEPFAFAGLWEVWRNPAGETVKSCTIITTTPNDLISEIHDRMPVILCPEECEQWLSPVATTTDTLSLLKPYPATEMEAYPVSRLVNSTKNEGQELIVRAQTSNLFYKN